MPISLRLVRSFLSKGNLFGTMGIDDLPIFTTVELPWNGNKKGASCIPPGEYQCAWKVSPRFGKALEIWNVPNRHSILIHPANRAIELEGCIGIGMLYGEVQGEPAILQSRVAFKKLQNILGVENPIITIEESPHIEALHRET